MHVCVCLYSQALGVAWDVGGNLCDPEAQPVADALGSFDQAGLNSGFDLHVRARHRGCSRLHHHNHYHYENHHHHHCSRSTVKFVVSTFKISLSLFFCFLSLLFCLCSPVCVYMCAGLSPEPTLQIWHECLCPSVHSGWSVCPLVLSAMQWWMMGACEKLYGRMRM